MPVFSVTGIYARSRVFAPHLGYPPCRRSRASVTFGRWKVFRGGVLVTGPCLALPHGSSSLLVAACRFRFGERHGQSSRLRLGGEAESPLEKLQVDYRPGAEEGIPQTVPLRWTDFQHARKWTAFDAATIVTE